MSTEHPNTQKTEHGTFRFFLYLACLARFDSFSLSLLALSSKGPCFASVRVAGTPAGGCERSFNKEHRSLAAPCVCALVLLCCLVVASCSTGILHPLPEAPAVPGSSLSGSSLSDTRSLSMSLFSGGYCYLLGIQQTAPKTLGSMSPSCNANTYCMDVSALEMSPSAFTLQLRGSRWEGKLTLASLNRS